MLALSRLRNESIVISDRATGAVLATVKVSDVRGGCVKMGIEAPPHIQVDRAERYAHHLAKRTAAATTPGGAA